MTTIFGGEDCEILEMSFECCWNGIGSIWTKESVDKGERGEWNNCLKTQYSKSKDQGI